MDKTQKKTIKKVVSWVMLAVLVAVLAIMPLLAGSSEEADGPVASILSVKPGYRDIENQLIGGGTLTSEDAIEITVPVEVKLKEYLVKNGDTVSEGDPIAKVDRVSVMHAITQVQEAMDALAEEIEEEGREVAPDQITARTSGTVKKLYAQPGDSVSEVMLQYGALAVISLDDQMAVRISCDCPLFSGDAVCVVLEDGTEVSGWVETKLSGVLTVTMEDKDYAVGQTVTVQSESGEVYGSGELYIHNQWNATAYSGTVKSVRIQEGNRVSSGRLLLTLEDTGNTPLYQKLVNQHREYEQLMLDLFVMYQTETITAPDDGVVYSVDDSGEYMLVTEDGLRLNLLSTPFGDDDDAYANIAVHIREISTDGNWIVNYNPNSFTVTDYTSISGYPTEMNDSGAIQIVPVYVFNGEEWVSSSAGVGDILLVAGNSGPIWAVKVGYSAIEPEEPEPSEDPDDPENPDTPSDPDDPENPDTPANPDDPENPDAPSEPGGEGTGTPTIPTIPGGINFGAFGGMFGSTPQEETEEIYSLDTVTVATVTPRRNMLLEIRIDELDINQLSVGQSAKVTVDALSGESFDAVITEIGNLGTSQGGNAKFMVKLRFDCQENMLTGMRASAFITLDTKPGVLTLPVAALNSDGSQTFVYTSYDSEEDVLGDPVLVTVGVSDGEYAEILSGITEDTTVYYSYYDTLTISNLPDSNGFSIG